MFSEYFAGWKTDRDAHGASLASLFEDLGGQTRLGVVMGAFDNPDGGIRDVGALSEYGSGRYGWQRGSAHGQMQKLSAGKFHGVPSQKTMRPRAVGFAAKADVSRYLKGSPADSTHAAEIGWGSARSLTARLGGYLSFASIRKGATAAIGPNATSANVHCYVGFRV
jgi:hypothetical protein